MYVEDYRIGEQNEQRIFVWETNLPEKIPKVDEKSLEYVCYTTFNFEALTKFEHRQTKGCEMSRLIHVSVAIPHLKIDSISLKAAFSFKMNEFFGSLQKMNKIIGMHGLINYR